MKKQLFSTLLFACSLTTLTAQTPVYLDDTQPIEARVKDALNRMTLEEKVALCHAQSKFSSPGVSRLGIPELWMSDGPHGVRAEINWNDWGYAKWTNDSITAFPALTCLAATWNPEMSAIYGKAIGEEARYREKDVLLGPGVNIYRTPLNGRNFEYMGEDPYLAGELGKQMILGLQAEGLAATPKHFAVYSIPVGGRDGGTRTDPHVAPREMKTLYLEPFRKGIQEAGALGVMSSYNDYDGEPVSGSYHFLTEILRQQWGFKGYVVSDSEAVEFLHTKHRITPTEEEMAAQVVNAGLNIRTNFTPPQDFILPLRRAISEGKISLHTLDQRVGEILRVKFMLGLFDNPYPGDDRHPETVVHNAAHQEVSMKAALESIVLLKNENQMLPLSKSLNKIAVIGPNAEEVKELTCRYGPAHAPIKTVYQGIKEYLPNAEVSYAKGCNIIDKYFPESELYNVPLDTQEQAMINEAVELAKVSDIAILVLGGNEKTVREEFSRTSLDLCGRQQQLLEAVYATGKPVVLVMVDGRAATINWANKYVPAIVHAWFPGEFMGNAIAKVLFGDYNPGGRLAVTFPKSVGQVPFAFPFKPGSDSKGRVRVDGVLYPFGYGLSYTTFEYSALKISKPVIGPQENMTLSCIVKNTGKRAGDEVVQLYIRDDFSSVTTYDKVLRGFERIHLQPGEEQTISFTLTPQGLGLWDKNNQFTVEPGSFSIMIGASSQDIRLKGSFEVQ